MERLGPRGDAKGEIGARFARLGSVVSLNDCPGLPLVSVRPSVIVWTRAAVPAPYRSQATRARLPLA